MESAWTMNALCPTHPKNRSVLPLVLVAVVMLAGCKKKKAAKLVTDGMVQIKAGKDTFYIDRFEYPNKAGVSPKKMIVFGDARETCASAGKRLCTDWEWRRACMGEAMKNTFGYGPSYKEGLCHSGLKLQSGHSGMTMEEGVVSPSGAKEACRTKEGVHDMVGNLEEWVLSSWNGSAGMLEGGAWFTIAHYASCNGNYSRQPHYRFNLKVPIYSAGFRCCWSRAAPMEKDLTKEMLARDSTQRLARAREQASSAKYEASDEVELAPGTFIDRFEYPNREGEWPRVGVSWEQADEACKEAGKRLCHVEEWEWACSGPKALKYPYGITYVPDKCAANASKPSRSGSFATCKSQGGVRDLSGGVWEWTADKMEAPAEMYGVNQILRHVRGGSWFVDPNDATCRPELGYPTAHQKSAFTDVGFRCCRGAAYKPPLARTKGTAKCPADMVSIKDFCVDRYEFPNKKGEIPLHDLTFNEAKTSCATVGLHVCTEQEWRLTCGGVGNRPWPYGFKYEAKTCHYGLLPNDENHIVAAGTMPLCKSPEGVFDLSGNAWEWTASSSGKGELRGGGSNISAGYGRCNARAPATDTFSTSETGVRCCGSQAEVDALTAKGGRPSLDKVLASLKKILTKKKNAPMQDRFKNGAPSDPPETEPPVHNPKDDRPTWEGGKAPPLTGEDRPTWEAGKGPKKPLVPTDDNSKYKEPPVIKPGSGPSWSPPTNKWELKRKKAAHTTEGSRPGEQTEPPPLPPEGDPRTTKQADEK